MNDKFYSTSPDAREFIGFDESECCCNDYQDHAVRLAEWIDRKLLVDRNQMPNFRFCPWCSQELAP